MKTALSENESSFHQTDQALTDKSAQCTEQIATPEVEIQELDEAIAAGRKAIVGLEQVIETLKSARRWGIWDILGGGPFSTLEKYSRINKAQEGISNVQRLMHQFKTELTDVQNQVELQIDISEFESFADFFLDGFIADWIVQNKITDALSRAQQVKATVCQAVSRLEGLKKDSSFIDMIDQ